MTLLSMVVIYILVLKNTLPRLHSDGLELDNAKWDTFARGLEWRGNWTATTRYRINDVTQARWTSLCL